MRCGQVITGQGVEVQGGGVATGGHLAVVCVVTIEGEGHVFGGHVQVVPKT